MIIYAPEIHKKESVIEYNFKVKIKQDIKEVFIQIDNNYSNLVSNLADTALIIMLLPAMVDKENIRVEGKLSKTLYSNLDNLQDLISKVIPACSKVSVSADHIVSLPKAKNPVVISGFSAGVDAFVTLDEFYLNPIHDFKLTHLLFNNLIYKDKIANDKLHHIKKLTNEVGIPVIQTKTNFHSLYNKKNIGFEQTHTIRNVAIAHLLSANGIKFLYSSSFPVKDLEIKPWPDIAIVNSLLLPLLSSDSVELIEVGANYTRVQKTKKVSQNPYSYKFLDICIKKKHLKSEFYNCSQCYKCMRALVTFEKLGVINKYKDLFDLELYYKSKDEYLKNLFDSTQLNDVDLQRFLNGEINANT